VVRLLGRVVAKADHEGAPRVAQRVVQLPVRPAHQPVALGAALPLGADQHQERGVAHVAQVAPAEVFNIPGVALGARHHVLVALLAGPCLEKPFPVVPVLLLAGLLHQQEGHAGGVGVLMMGVFGLESCKASLGCS